MRRSRNGWRREFSRRAFPAALTVIAAGFLLTAPQAQADDVSCRDLYIPVSVLKTSQTMYGKLCTPAEARTVQVLVPGGTYNSSYWDIGYTPEIRSFRRAMNRAGYATLTVDRLGTGRSSKPPSASVTAIVQGRALHDVVQAMRSGAQGPRFDRVILGGHSIGSAMVMIEAGTFHDVDGVLITGMTHRMNLITVAPVLANMIPAPLDPQLNDRGLDVGYLTTKPGIRYDAFHTPGPNIAGAMAYEESTKDVFAVTEAVDTTLLTTVVIPVSRKIDVPVMLVVGEDRHYCGEPLGADCSSAEALHRSEAPFYPSAPSLRTYVLRGYGHSINYAPNAPEYHQAVVSWADSIT